MRRSRTRTTLCLACVSCAAAASLTGALAGGGVTVAPDVDISRASGVQSEVSVAIDPSNPSVLLAGSNDFDSASGRTRAYGSTDGGLTWTSSANPPLPPVGTCAGDPAVGIDATGRQYFAFLVGTCKFTSQPIRLALYVAGRAGPDAEWTTPPTPVFGVPGFDDKPALAVDTVPVSPYPNRVYVAWSRISATSGGDILVSSSDDGGTTWSPPAETGASGTYASLAVGPGGVLYLAWDQGLTLSIARSTDGGAHFEKPQFITVGYRAPTPACLAHGTSIPAAPHWCVRSNPVVTVDTSSGPYSGRVYVTYGGRGLLETEDVFLAALDPSLHPFFTRRRINPPDGSVRADEFWPASAVDRSTGRLWTCYYDTRGDPRRTRAFYSCTASDDGGQRWTRPVRAASKPSNEAGRRADFREYGDYEGLAAAAGAAHPVWTDSRSLRPRREEIYTTTLR